MKADVPNGTTNVHLGTLGYCVLMNHKHFKDSTISPQKISLI